MIPNVTPILKKIWDTAFDQTSVMFPKEEMFRMRHYSREEDQVIQEKVIFC